MSIKIVFEERDALKQPLFKDVNDDQLFIDDEGRLCQKVSEDCYNIITDSEGLLYGDQVNDVDGYEKIRKLLPAIARIEY